MVPITFLDPSSERKPLTPALSPYGGPGGPAIMGEGDILQGRRVYAGLRSFLADPYMWSGYDFLAISHVQVFSQSHDSMGVLLAALFHAGERSEPEWNSAARSCKQQATPTIPAPVAVLPALCCCVPFDSLLFLRRQENEAGALAQRAVGGVRELVQPSDGLRPARSPARAAHARCSKLERLPERRPGPSARISKDE